MKTGTRLAGIAALMVASAAYAHTHLKSSIPAQGSVLTAAPPAIVLKFSEATRVTALTVQKKGAAEQRLAPLPTSVSEEIKVPAPTLAAGKYVLNWRAVGDDGHLMTGKVEFTIDPAAKPGMGKAPENHKHAH